MGYIRRNNLKQFPDTIVNSEKETFVPQMRAELDALGLTKWQVHDLSITNVGARVLEN